MGTRAAFWVGNPINLENREWLGCTAYDGYPGGFVDVLADAKTEEEFRKIIEEKIATMDDFSSPKNGGFPFPWSDNIFLTDYTYAFFDGSVKVACFYTDFVDLKMVLEDDKFEFGEDVEKHSNVPAPADWDRNQPDSIIILTRRKGE